MIDAASGGMKPFDKWTVLPHGKLTALDDDLLTVVGDLHMPVGDFPRRMTVVRLGDRRLVIYSAIALEEDEMAQLESWGTPAYLVVPSRIHRMDAHSWKARYPELKVVTPPGARETVEEVVPVDETDVDFQDPKVHYTIVPGTQDGEAALLVEGQSGSTLIVNDVIWNVHHRPGLRGWLLRALGFTGDEPKIPKLVAKKSVKDLGAFRAQLDAWSRIADLKRIVVSHGELVTGDAPAVLRDLSARLAA